LFVTIAIAVKVHDGVVLAADSAASIMHPAGAAHGLAAWVYNNANKVFRLGKDIRVGGVVWGAGSIGPVSISTLARDLEKRFADGGDPLGVVPAAYTVEDVANKVRRFFYEERYLAAYPAPPPVAPAPAGGPPPLAPPERPSLGLLVAGFSTGADLAEVYRIEINAGTCPAPILAKPAPETGYLWYGQPEALNRLLEGYDARLRMVFEQIFQQMGMPADQIGPQAEALMPQIKAAFDIPLYTDPMPIQDAIDLAEFLAQTASGFSRFRAGSRTVGGPIEIAAITKHDGFKWITHKQYYEERLNRDF
jgi:hypothetical protein